jgi:hypothetical protein
MNAVSELVMDDGAVTVGFKRYHKSGLYGYSSGTQNGTLLSIADYQ